jgi:hypothetical protein
MYRFGSSQSLPHTCSLSDNSDASRRQLRITPIVPQSGYLPGARSRSEERRAPGQQRRARQPQRPVPGRAQGWGGALRGRGRTAPSPSGLHGCPLAAPPVPAPRRGVTPAPRQPLSGIVRKSAPPPHPPPQRPNPSPPPPTGHAFIWLLLLLQEHLISTALHAASRALSDRASGRRRSGGTTHVSLQFKFIHQRHDVVIYHLFDVKEPGGWVGVTSWAVRLRSSTRGCAMARMHLSSMSQTASSRCSKSDIEWQRRWLFSTFCAPCTCPQ